MPIRGHLELVGDDPEERREAIELATDELDRMNRLVQDLLTLARAERPAFLSLEEVEIRPFLEEIVSKAGALGDLEWQIEAGRVPHEAMMDRQRLSQAILNLADNAIQQTGVSDPLTVGVEAEGRDRLRFWIGDPGPGIELSFRYLSKRFARNNQPPYCERGSQWLTESSSSKTNHGWLVSSKRACGQTALPLRLRRMGLLPWPRPGKKTPT